MRELIEHWCQSRRVFFPQKQSMEVAAVSTAARDSDVTVSAVGWHGSWHEKEHGKGKSREKGKEGKKGKEKGGEKSMGKSNSGIGGTSIISEVDRTVPWLLWSLVEMGSQEGPVPSMAGASSNGTQCNGVSSFTVCCFWPWILCVATCPSSEFSSCLTCLLVVC